VCSIDTPALRRLAEAIDRLEAERKSADPAQLATRIAAIWAMVAEMDPKLARLASRYAAPPAPATPASGTPQRAPETGDGR
jgi:pyrroloquinoline quinone (PQQ) biosynthesis protein C